MLFWRSGRVVYVQKGHIGRLHGFSARTGLEKTMMGINELRCGLEVTIQILPFSSCSSSFLHPHQLPNVFLEKPGFERYIICRVRKMQLSKERGVDIKCFFAGTRTTNYMSFFSLQHLHYNIILLSKSGQGFVR
jgi:hypothetical protein